MRQMETLFSVEEAAKRLGGISKWTIHSWLSKGRLQRTKVGGRTMIRESELASLIGVSPLTISAASLASGSKRPRQAGTRAGRNGPESPAR